MRPCQLPDCEGCAWWREHFSRAFREPTPERRAFLDRRLAERTGGFLGQLPTAAQVYALGEHFDDLMRQIEGRYGSVAGIGCAFPGDPL